MRISGILLGCVLLGGGLPCAHPTEGLALTEARAREIGQRIWKNECGGTISGLTSWNKGEDFPSLGIAHFIWYPAGRRGPFEESFPGLVRYLASKGHEIPTWLEGPCPWGSRAAFLADIESFRLKSLRALLARTVAEQATYAALRLERALPKMLAAAPPLPPRGSSQKFLSCDSRAVGPLCAHGLREFQGRGDFVLRTVCGSGLGIVAGP